MPDAAQGGRVMARTAMVKMLVRFPAQVMAWVEEIAAEEGRSKAEVIRMFTESVARERIKERASAEERRILLQMAWNPAHRPGTSFLPPSDKKRRAERNLFRPPD